MKAKKSVRLMFVGWVFGLGTVPLATNYLFNADIGLLDEIIQSDVSIDVPWNAFTTCFFLQ